MPLTPRPTAYVHFPSQADLFYLCTTSSTSEEDLDIHYAPPSQSSLKVGVIILSNSQIQLLDLAAIDLLSMISRHCIEKLGHVPNGVLEICVDEVDIRYISESGEGSFSVTSGARMPVTNSFANAPALDILIIPGSFSSDEISHSASEFLTTQAMNPNLIAVLSIASGILPLIQTPLLHNKKVTAPPSLLPNLRQQFPETFWQERPWVKDDNIWSSSSAVAAIDMLAAWMRQYFWDRSEAIEWTLRAAGVAPVEGY